MRLPLIAVLILLVPGAVRAGSLSPKLPQYVAPIDPQAAARGVARYRETRGPSLAVRGAGQVCETSGAAIAGVQTAGLHAGEPPPQKTQTGGLHSRNRAMTSVQSGPASPDRGPHLAAGPEAPETPAKAGGASAAASDPPAAPATPASSPTLAMGTASPVPAAPPFIGPPPPLSLSAFHAVVPVGESREVTITGAARPPDLSAVPAEIVAGTVAPGPLAGTWSLELEGLAPGEAAVRVSIDDRAQTLSVKVMKYAGQVSAASVEITGQPATVEFVLHAARAAVEEAVTREPGAVAVIASPSRMPPELPAGQAAAVSFPVSIAGPDLLPVTNVAAVTVRNRDLDPRDVGVLLYSNDPERVGHPGVLFAAELAPDRPARLLYHHQNASEEPLRVRVELVNPSDQPVDVQVIDGAAGPTWDAVEAGHRAAARYVRSSLQDLGTIVRVPARSEQAIVLQRLPPRTTVSGLFGLRGLGAGLFVRVVAEAEAEPVVALRPAEKPDRLSDQVYLAPLRPLSARYVVGKNWAFLNLGSDPLVTRETHRKLAGNYGVSYEWTLNLNNPTDQPQSVVLTLSPDAGAARGVFVIDGAVIEAPEVSPPVEAALATFELQPGERRVVRVQTLPVGGSSYPARLVIRPMGALRTAQTVVGK